MAMNLNAPQCTFNNVGRHQVNNIYNYFVTGTSIRLLEEHFPVLRRPAQYRISCDHVQIHPPSIPPQSDPILTSRAIAVAQNSLDVISKIVGLLQDSAASQLRHDLISELDLLHHTLYLIVNALQLYESTPLGPSLNHNLLA